MIRALPVGQPEGHGGDLTRGQAGDEALHLVPDAPHQLGNGRAVDAAQVHLVLKDTLRLETQWQHQSPNGRNGCTLGIVRRFG